MSQGFDVAILGATGAVGAEFLSQFERRSFPVRRLRLLASARSAGQPVVFCGDTLNIEEATRESITGAQIAFLSAGAQRSREFAPYVIESGGFVIDNSSAFRMDKGVPLVVPEVNIDALKPEHRLVANPNCTAAILLMAVAPLRDLGHIERITLSTYQSASGAGAQAMEELRSQTRNYLDGELLVPKVMPHPYAFNLFSHNTPIGEDGYNDEETKVIAECRKILDEPQLRIGVTCVRVPVMRAHSISATIEFSGQAPDETVVRARLSEAPGVKVVDDRAKNHFPMPNEASGIEDVLVGRIRRDVSHPSAISLFIAGDQLLKGAALNAVQIAEAMIAKGYLRADE